MSQYWNIQTNFEDNTTNLGNAYTEGYGQISVLLNKYVLKEKGKGLSTNDFTNNDKQKLDSVEIGAERNVLETITINCGAVYRADNNKNINLNIATKTSQLENDSQFAVLEEASEYADYRDSYVGKSKTSFNDSTNIAIGKNSTAMNCGIAIGECSNSNGGIAIGRNASTSNVYDVNINNQAKYNKNTSLWEMKTTDSVLADCATSNINGTDLTCLDTVISNLSDEIQTRCYDDEILQCNINCICNRVCAIESYIPNQTSDENQLADKDFVNSSIQTSTANFRGNWTDWTEVPFDSSEYPPDYIGNTTPTVNDYLVLQNASDYPLETLEGTWRFKYIGDWAIQGKNGWIPEYQVNEEPFTSEQLYAINSGITDVKVANYDLHLINTNNPHNVTKSQVGLNNVDNTADNTKCVKDSVCFNGLTYAEVCADIQNGMGGVTGIDVYCDSTCVCTIDDATSLYLGTNAFNSTSFTTCTGTVTISNTTENCDIPIALCTDSTSVGKSNTCSLTFNPSSGLVCATAFCGDLCGSVTNSCCADLIKICETQTNSSLDVALIMNNCPYDELSWGTNDLGCRLLYNPYSGYLVADCFCGSASKFNGCTYACACADIRSGLTSCTGTVTSINVSVNGCGGTAVTSSGTVTISGVCTCVGNLTNTTTTKQNILMTANTTAGCKLINTSSTCPFTFTPSTGLVCAKCFCGCFCGTLENATCFNGCTYACACDNIRSGLAQLLPPVTDILDADLPIVLCRDDKITSMCLSNDNHLYFNPKDGRIVTKSIANIPRTTTASVCCLLLVAGCGTRNSYSYYGGYIRGDNGYYYGNICGILCGLASRANYSACLYNRQTGASKVSNVYFYTSCTNASCTATNQASCICGANGYYYGCVCGNLCGSASKLDNYTRTELSSVIFKKSNGAELVCVNWGTVDCTLDMRTIIGETTFDAYSTYQKFAYVMVSEYDNGDHEFYINTDILSGTGKSAPIYVYGTPYSRHQSVSGLIPFTRYICMWNVNCASSNTDRRTTIQYVIAYSPNLFSYVNI